MFGWAHELGPAKFPGPHIGVFVAMSDAVRLAELFLARAVTLRGVVPSRVAWAMAADDQAWCVTWEQISSAPGEVTPVVAHRVLEEFREFASGDIGPDRTVAVLVPAMDLTDGHRFDWWAYLKGHPEGKDIVGQGVTKFELRFLAARDPNTNQQRLDFIVHRRTAADQHPHVRLHPHRHKLKHNGRLSRKEAFPVYGFLPEWLGESIPGIDDGADSPVGLTQDRAKHAVPRHDIIGRNSALTFIEKLNSEERAWIVDLTRGDVFHWHRYLRSSSLLEVDAFTLLQGRRTQVRGGRWVEFFLGLGQAARPSKSRLEADALEQF